MKMSLARPTPLGIVVLAAMAVGLGLRIAAARGGLWLDEAWSAVYAAQAQTPIGVFLRINHDNNHHLNSLWLQAIGLAAPPLLARAGSAIPVDLAKGGFRPEPFQRGLWLFPCSGEGRFDWSFTEDEGEQGPQDLWSGEVVCRGDSIHITVRRDRPGTFADDRLTILLPPGERRRLTGAGGISSPTEQNGRSGITIEV